MQLRPSRRLSPPVGRYQIILLGDRGTWVWVTCPGLLLYSEVAVALCLDSPWNGLLGSLNRLKISLSSPEIKFLSFFCFFCAINAVTIWYGWWLAVACVMRAGGLHAAPHRVSLWSTQHGALLAGTRCFCHRRHQGIHSLHSKLRSTTSCNQRSVVVDLYSGSAYIAIFGW